MSSEILENLYLPSLKTCPFCGEPGYIIKTSLKNYKGHYHYMAGCINALCQIRPHSREWDDIYRKSDVAISKAAKAWNCRKE